MEVARGVKRGRLKPVTVEGTEFSLDAASVVFATGQKHDLRFIAAGAGLELNQAGLLAYDDQTKMIAREGLFLAGDAVNGKGSVALASGRKAALAVDNLLQGRGFEPRVEHGLTSLFTSRLFSPAGLSYWPRQETISYFTWWTDFNNLIW